MRSMFATIFLSGLFTTAHAGQFFPVGKSGAVTYYTSVERCESTEGQACFDTTGKDLRYHEIQTIQENDLSKPIQKTRYNVTACSSDEDCNAQVQAAGASFCESGDTFSILENSLMPGWTFGCTGISGYEQRTVTTLVEVPALKSSVLSQDATDQAIQAGILDEIKDKAFGEKVMAYVGYLNKQKNLSISQIQTLRGAISAAEDALSVGAIEAARAAVDGYSPDGTLLTAADKTAILAMIDGYLAQ